MNELLDFHIVGCCFRPPAAQACLAALEGGETLELRPEPNNPVDPLAIAVYLDNIHVGYVPNRGTSCTHCHKKLSYKDKYCPECGGDIAAWGVAGRLVHSKQIELPHKAFVKEVLLDDGKPRYKDGWVYASILWTDPDAPSILTPNP